MIPSLVLGDLVFRSFWGLGRDYIKSTGGGSFSGEGNCEPLDAETMPCQNSTWGRFIRGFPNLRSSLLGALIIRTIVFGGLYWVPVIFGRLPFV